MRFRSHERPRDGSRWSAGDLVTTGFVHTPEYASLIETTRPVRDIDIASFDAIVVAGGQGPLFTFEKAVDLPQKFADYVHAGRPLARIRGA